MSQVNVNAALASLERVLQQHAHLAPEFAMMAAQAWADSYVHVEPVKRVMYIQPSMLQRFNDGLIENVTFHRTMQFPFTHPVEVSI